MKATLEVAEGGVRTDARVVCGGRACDLDAVIEAATQADADTAAAYRGILADIAPGLYLVVVKEIDGSPDAGCCWYGVALMRSVNGPTLTRRVHRLTRTEFPGWNPTPEQVRAEEAAILRRAAAIGLGQAQSWVGTARTVAERI